MLGIRHHIKVMLGDGAIYRAYHWYQKARWLWSGRPVPPPHVVKQEVLRDVARRFRLDTMVETGTYKGDMVFAIRRDFSRIISIELSPELCRLAKNRFADADHVTIRQGDSADVLPQIVGDLEGPALFWLDGHFSGGPTSFGDRETPIIAELKAIAGSQHSNVILIDDARCFTMEEHDYPSLDELWSVVCRLLPEYTMNVEDDIVRIAPNSSERDSGG